MGSRELPCPNRIFDDIGGGFGMGLLGGTVFYFFKGLFNSPKRERFFGGIQHLKRRAPVLGGNFALWAGLFSTFDCALLYVRNVDDHINPIVSGFVTGGLLAIRAGPRVAFRNAIFGGIILGMIQLVEVIMIRWQKQAELKMYNSQVQDEIERQKARRNMEMEKYKSDIEKRRGPQVEQRVVQF